MEVDWEVTLMIVVEEGGPKSGYSSKLTPMHPCIHYDNYICIATLTFLAICPAPDTIY